MGSTSSREEVLRQTGAKVNGSDGAQRSANTKTADAEAKIKESVEEAGLPSEVLHRLADHLDGLLQRARTAPTASVEFAMTAHGPSFKISYDSVVLSGDEKGGTE